MAIEPSGGRGLNFTLNDALAQFSAQQTIVNSLWAFYAVTCYAAGGFKLPADPRQRMWVAFAVTLGFWAFTIGHMFSLSQSLGIMAGLNERIAALLPPAGGHAVKLADGVAGATVPAGHVVLVHLIIDTAVTIAIWARVLVSARGSPATIA